MKMKTTRIFAAAFAALLAAGQLAAQDPAPPPPQPVPPPPATEQQQPNQQPPLPQAPTPPSPVMEPATAPQTAVPPSQAGAEPASREIRRFEVKRATAEIRIDGVLDEPAWQEALRIDMPYEWYPLDNGRPPVETYVYVTYSDSRLLVAFEAFDPEPAKIRAHLMDRDDLTTLVADDYVGMNIDTFNDERQALQFRVNPLGVQADGTFDEFKGTEDFAWDAIWDSAAKVGDRGYVVEISIPFQQMRFPRTADVQTWGFEGFRNYPRNDRHRISTKFTDRNKECTLCQENKISGFEGLKPGRNIQVTPTVTGIRVEQATSSFPDGGLETMDEDAELGLDARWSITPNLTLNATINPDFSQVEADTAQLAINTRFALFFPEKRPFFLEGADFFETPLRVVFTRTLAEPNYGVKLTGKEGKGAIGAYLVEDDITNFIIPSNQRTLFGQIDDQVLNGVLRYRHDLGSRSAVGVLYAGREGDEYSNELAGADTFIALNPSNVVRAQYVQSETKYPGGFGLENVDGDAFHLSYLHVSRFWFARAIYEDIDEDFRADSGFIPRVDFKRGEGILERNFWGTRETWYRKWILGARKEVIEDQAGNETDDTTEVYFQLEGPRQSFIRTFIGQRDQFYQGRTFELEGWTFFGQISPNRRSRLTLNANGGDEIDVDNVRQGNQITIQPSWELKFGKHINWRFQHLRTDFDVGGRTLFKAQLTQTRFVYQFNVRTFVRAILQYQDVERNPENYLFPVGRREKDLLSQLLFSYKINPQTVIFAGYTENGFGNQNFSVTATDRTYFLKVGYAFLY
jgi:hypothetical protein